MSRNSSGTYTLPAGNPVVSATTISTTWANTTLGDFATEITDSASRSGKGGFTAPVRGVDGSAAAPAVSFTSEPGTGLYKSAAGEFAISLLGALAAKFTAVGLNITAAARAFLQSTAANSVVQILGNRNATDTGADVEFNGQATRTAGFIAHFDNNGVVKMAVDFQGLARLDAAAVAAALQPTALWTALTPNTNVTVQGGAAYWKDAIGIVHLKGSLRNSTGAPVTLLVSTTPLPAGFRPITGRNYPALDNSGTPQMVGIAITTAGVIQTYVAQLGNAADVFLDGISFLAEQ